MHRDEVRPTRSIELNMYNTETSVSPLPPLIPSPLQPLLVSFLLLSKLLDTMLYAHFYLISHTHCPPQMVFTPATYSKTSSEVYGRQNFASWLSSSGVYSCNYVTLHGRRDFTDAIMVTNQ